MKLLKISIVLILGLCSLMCSCIDSDYHLDNINTEGVLQIPPVPLGTYDAIKIKDLGGEILEIEGLPSMTIEYPYILNNIFGSDVIKDFFHPYMTHDLSIDGILDVDILGIEDEGEGLKISIEFAVLKSNNEILDKIKIKGIAEEDIRQGKQPLSIVFREADGKLMQDAQHLLIKIKLRKEGSITLREGDYLQFSNLVIKTGGYYVHL